MSDYKINPDFFEPRMITVPVADHVSKSELRAWCEENHWPDFICPEIKLLNMTKLLEKFCEGEK